MSFPVQREEGSALIELVLLVPVIAALLWLVLWAGTAGQTPGEVDLAASDAARSAAASRDAGARAGRAEQLVQARLSETCDELSVATAQTDRVVSVTVRCSMQTEAMSGLGVGARTFEAVGVSTVDRFLVEVG